MDNFSSSSLDDTKLYCRKLFKRIILPSCIYLNGDVGVGKTFICNEIAKYYNIHDINSSSFSIVQCHRSIINLIHCDFYRQSYTTEFFFTEIEPLLFEPWIILCEWNDIMFDLPDSQSISINIVKTTSSNREIITKID